mmetsp:Transcript_19705/g.47742  ORF Transcript_19705/g.47742 Transcript_19705/m.47742 type:complete len:205 (-) Transcript_19705:1455-2069(-)
MREGLVLVHLVVRRCQYVDGDRDQTSRAAGRPVVHAFGQVDQQRQRVLDQIILLRSQVFDTALSSPRRYEDILDGVVGGAQIGEGRRGIGGQEGRGGAHQPHEGRRDHAQILLRHVLLRLMQHLSADGCLEAGRAGRVEQHGKQIGVPTVSRALVEELLHVLRLQHDREDAVVEAVVGAECGLLDGLDQRCAVEGLQHVAWTQV